MSIHINFDKIPAAIKDVLSSEGITESELADRVGISQPVMNRLVNGESSPSITTFEKLWPIIGEHLTSHNQ